MTGIIDEENQLGIVESSANSAYETPLDPEDETRLVTMAWREEREEGEQRWSTTSSAETRERKGIMVPSRTMAVYEPPC